MSFSVGPSWAGRVVCFRVMEIEGSFVVTQEGRHLSATLTTQTERRRQAICLLVVQAGAEAVFEVR